MPSSPVTLDLFVYIFFLIDKNKKKGLTVKNNKKMSLLNNNQFSQGPFDEVGGISFYFTRNIIDVSEEIY